MLRWKISILLLQGGSNITGTDLSVNKPHMSRSYLKHLVLLILLVQYYDSVKYWGNFLVVHGNVAKAFSEHLYTTYSHTSSLPNPISIFVMIFFRYYRLVTLILKKLRPT
jgi:hypothetical protein